HLAIETILGRIGGCNGPSPVLSRSREPGAGCLGPGTVEVRRIAVNPSIIRGEISRLLIEIPHVSQPSGAELYRPVRVRLKLNHREVVMQIGIIGPGRRCRHTRPLIDPAWRS